MYTVHVITVYSQGFIQRGPWIPPTPPPSPSKTIKTVKQSASTRNQFAHLSTLLLIIIVIGTNTARSPVLGICACYSGYRARGVRALRALVIEIEIEILAQIFCILCKQKLYPSTKNSARNPDSSIHVHGS